MAHELAFAFSNETPQAQCWGLIILKSLSSLCRLPWKDGSQFLRQLPISWGLSLLHRQERLDMGDGTK